MSLNLTPLQTYTVRYPPTDINSHREFGILKGGSNVAIRIGTTTSFSNSNVTFSLPPANPDTIYDRRMYIKYSVVFTFTGTAPAAPNGNLLVPGCDALRAFPLSSVMSNVTLKINNTSNSINLKDGIQAFLRYHNYGNMRQIEYSAAPSMLDFFQQYSDGFNTNRNSLAQYGDDSFDYSRGGFTYDSILQTPNLLGVPGPASTVIHATITEPIWVSPLLFGSDQGPGLIGIQSFELQIQWGDLTRMWSHDAVNGNTISNIAVDMVSGGTPALLITQIIPQDLQVIPKNSVYSYFEMQNYSTNVGVLNAHGDPFSLDFTTLASNNVQLGSIPRKVYIYARKRNADLTFNDPDVFAGIISISINWNGKDGQLSSASQNDLYNISKKNGCNQSWSEWKGNTQFIQTNPATATPQQSFVGLTGSVLCLNFGEDIGQIGQSELVIVC